MADGDICVIIPFYQREKGILTRAVRSILDQRPAGPASVIVVDDGSPVPAEAELAELLPRHGDLIRIVAKENGGPGQAPNVGLDSVPPEARFVAFLDSDDVWFEDYLETAMAALGLGYDFYFCDFFQVDQETSLFRRHRPIRIEDHRLLDADRRLYAFTGDIIEPLVRNNFIRTSGAVFRWPPAQPVRFDEDLRWSDEDTLFWLELCSVTERIVFCAEPHVRQGRGVNINAVAPFGEAKLSKILVDEVRFAKLALRRFARDDALKDDLAALIAAKRRNFIRNALALLVRGNLRENAELIRRYRSVDADLFAHVVPFVLGAAMRKLRIGPGRSAAERG